MRAARLELRPPTLFRSPTILALGFYGIMVSIPIIAAVLLVSVRQLSAWTFVLPLLAMAVAVFLMPFGFGNPLLVRRVKRLEPPPDSSSSRFVVQLTLTPRVRTGWRATFEDADDLGWVVISDAGVDFYGDSVSLTLPWSASDAPRLQTSGWRGLFLCGPRVRLSTTALPNVSQIEFAERASWTLPGSRRIAARMYQSFARWRNACPPEPKVV